MANPNSPFGLAPMKDNGTPWVGIARLCNVPAAQTGNIFRGDPVVALGGGDAFGCPAVGIASAGAANPILGVCVGINNGPSGSGFTVTRDLPIYRQASISNYILVCDDPNILFAVQEDSVGGAIPQATAEFANVNLVAGAGGNLFTGVSSWQVQSSSASSSANPTYQFRLLELLRGPGNALGANAVWVGRLNNAQLWSTTGV
jgi:hypothetical protein